MAMLVLANRMLHDENAARDIVHDVFASLLSGNIDSVTESYLQSGVRSACLTHSRSLSLRERLRNLYAIDCSNLDDERWPNEEAIARLNDMVTISEITLRIT